MKVNVELPYHRTERVLMSTFPSDHVRKPKSLSLIFMFDLWLNNQKHTNNDYPVEDMPSLYLKCKTCGVKFESGIVMEKRGMEAARLIYNQHTCPNGHIHTYNKKDFFF